MSKQPLVYIILINWNGLKDTLDCLKSLQKIDYKNFKVVVVDNGSKNNEASKIKTSYPKVILIKNSRNEGFCGANNQGMKLAMKKGSRYVMLLNNDTVVAKNFLSELVSWAESHNKTGVVNPKILYFNSEKVWAMGGSLNPVISIPRMIGQGKPGSDFKNEIYPDFASGCCMLIPRIVIKKVGYLDEKYFAYYDDNDYSYRVKAAGFKIVVIPSSVIWHKVSQSTFQKSLKKIGTIQSYLLARNGLVFGALNLKGGIRIIYILSQVFLKTPLYLLLKVQDLNAFKSYLRGITEGLLFLFTGKLKRLAF